MKFVPLVSLFVLSNILLFYSYYVLGANEEDFKNTPHSLRAYMLYSASIAYTLNIIQVIVMLLRGVSAHLPSLIFYYVLQLAFIPVVRFGDRLLVRSILFCACYPFYRLLSLSSGYFETSIAFLQFAHVFVNDFLLYGFLH